MKQLVQLGRRRMQRQPWHERLQMLRRARWSKTSSLTRWRLTQHERRLRRRRLRHDQPPRRQSQRAMQRWLPHEPQQQKRVLCCRRRQKKSLLCGRRRRPRHEPQPMRRLAWSGSKPIQKRSRRVQLRSSEWLSRRKPWSFGWASLSVCARPWSSSSARPEGRLPASSTTLCSPTC